MAQIKRSEFSEVVEGAWRSYGRAAALRSRVTPAVPILFFGDIDAYFRSRLRVVTVGLNPSSREFPTDDPFQRFPLAERIDCADLGRYLDALSAYFRADPYAGWFRAWEPLLNGAGASYYPGAASTALHTDICSLVATDPAPAEAVHGTRSRPRLRASSCNSPANGSTPTATPQVGICGRGESGNPSPSCCAASTGPGRADVPSTCGTRTT